MNQLDMMILLVDACRPLPEADIKRSLLRVAIKTAARRIEVLRARKARRDEREADYQAYLTRITLKRAEDFAAAGRCHKCGYMIPNCHCSEVGISKVATVVPMYSEAEAIARANREN